MIDILSNNVYVINRFCDKSICETLIEDLVNLNVFPDIMHSDLLINLNLEDNLQDRDSKRIVYSSKELAGEIWSALLSHNILEIVPDAVAVNESIRFYKYLVGDYFLPHLDSPVKISNDEYSEHSLLIYLNHNFEGGATKFGNLYVEPHCGKLVFFNHNEMHSGEPVLNSVKYILRSDIISNFSKK